MTSEKVSVHSPSSVHKLTARAGAAVGRFQETAVRVVEDGIVTADELREVEDDKANAHRAIEKAGSAVVALGKAGVA